jgi:hypothetical protein
LKVKRTKDEKGSKPPTESSTAPPTDEPHPSSPPPNTQADDQENNFERGVLGSEGRPQGQKAAKQKRDDDILFEKVLKTQEELIRISKERMHSVQSAMQTAEDHRIMAMDLTNMDEESKMYWTKMKRAILDRPEASSS